MGSTAISAAIENCTINNCTNNCTTNVIMCHNVWFSVKANAGNRTHTLAQRTLFLRIQEAMRSNQKVKHQPCSLQQNIKKWYLKNKMYMHTFQEKQLS